MKKYMFIILSAIIFTFIILPASASAQEIVINEINFPDAVFREYVAENFDSDENGALSDEEINAVKEIDVMNMEIYDLTGIGYFTSLEILDCRYNTLESLDVSTLTKLQTLYCSYNNLTALDVSANPNLNVLHCVSNQLTELDVQANTELLELGCGNNENEEIDDGNKFTGLDVSNLSKLQSLHCCNAPLETLNLEGCSSLLSLQIRATLLTEVDVSDCTALALLSCQKNPYLTSLDVSNCPSIASLSCQETGIKTLKLHENLMEILEDGEFMNHSDRKCDTYYLDYSFISVDEELTHTVSFDGNGAEGSMDAANGVLDEYTLPACEFTKPFAKNFKAWAIGGIDGEQKKPDDKITVSEDTVIYAIWEDYSVYPVYAGGVQFTADNMIIDENDNAALKGSASLEVTDTGYKLTLDNFEYEGSGFHGWGCIECTYNEPIEIILKGDNVLRQILQDSRSSRALYVAGDLTISGEGGSLSAYACDVSTEEGSASSSGICAFRSLTINSGTIKAYGGNATGAIWGESAGIATRYGDITINGGTVLASAKEGKSTENTYHVSNGIFSETFDIIINGGKLEITSYGCGINAECLTIEGGEITIEADKGEHGEEAAIYAEDELTLGDGIEIVIPQNGTVGAVSIEGNRLSYNDIPEKKDGIYHSVINGDGSIATNVKIAKKLDPELSLTSDKTSLSGGGTVKLTVGGLYEGAIVTVTCDDETYNPTEDGGVWKVKLPNKTQTYLFTVSFDGDETYSSAIATCQIDVISKISSGGSGVTRYTVKFETNGGSTISNKTVTRNSKLEEPTAPTKDGYSFNGWYTDEELTEKYDFDSKVTKGFTLYAKWEKVDEENSATSENPFTDVKTDDWFFEDMMYAYTEGLMKGVTNTTFAPNDNLTRAMLVTVLYRLEGEPATNRSVPFADIDMGAYYANAVIWAQQNGIVKGVSETEFAPNDNITREQIAAIMHRYAQYKGYDVSVGENTNILSYDDFDSISEYAISAMQYACGSGLMKGRSESTLNPLDNATRAEIAAILHRFIEANK